MPSNYRMFILGGIVFVCGAGFAFLEMRWIAWALFMVAIACSVGFVMLTIARVQRTDETREEAAERGEATEDKFDPEP